MRVGDYVLRDQDHPWPQAVTEALAELANRNYVGCPTVVAQREKQSVLLTFMPGSALTDPVPAWAAADSTLRSVTAFLKNFSMAGNGIRNVVKQSDWLIPPLSRGSVFVHGDPHPTNIIFDSRRNPTAIIDFELATVGSHDWNLASLLYTWAPLEPIALTCWRGETALSPRSRIMEVLSIWPPESSIASFLRIAATYVTWRSIIFQTLSDMGNVPAQEFVAGSTFVSRHDYARDFLASVLQSMRM